MARLPSCARITYTPNTVKPRLSFQRFAENVAHIHAPQRISESIRPTLQFKPRSEIVTRKLCDAVFLTVVAEVDEQLFLSDVQLHRNSHSSACMQDGLSLLILVNWYLRFE